MEDVARLRSRVLTLLGIMARPFRWNEAHIAMAGAGVLLLLGLISPADAFFTLIRDWNTFLFFLGMMGLSALARITGHSAWLHRGYDVWVRPRSEPDNGRLPGAVLKRFVIIEFAGLKSRNLRLLTSENGDLRHWFFSAIEG